LLSNEHRRYINRWIHAGSCKMALTNTVSVMMVVLILIMP
jgi:hypothetical protein